jgi:hypothetical protein
MAEARAIDRGLLTGAAAEVLASRARAALVARAVERPGQTAALSAGFLDQVLALRISASAVAAVVRAAAILHSPAGKRSSAAVVAAAAAVALRLHIRAAQQAAKALVILSAALAQQPPQEWLAPTALQALLVMQARVAAEEEPAPQ